MMKKNIELKAFILSVIATVALKLTYNVSIIPVIISINVITAVISYYLLNKSEKRIAQELEEKEEYNDKKLEIITKILEEKLELDKKNYEQINALFNKTVETNLKQKIETDILLQAVNTQVQSIVGVLSEVKLELENENSNVLDLTKVEKDSFDKLIDNETSLRSLEDKMDEIVESLRELGDVSKDKRELMSSLKNETNRSLEDIIQSNEKIETSYKQIHQSSISELVKLTSKNEYILNLLLDSYKVLKEIASTT